MAASSCQPVGVSVRSKLPRLVRGLRATHTGGGVPSTVKSTHVELEVHRSGKRQPSQRSTPWEPYSFGVEG